MSFSISCLETVFKENDVFGDLSSIALIFGWFLYFITRFSNGSSELTLFTGKSSYFEIFNLATILEKKLLKISNISLLLPKISSFSVSVIFSLIGLLSEKKGLTVFQNNLLSVSTVIGPIILFLFLGIDVRSPNANIYIHI